MANFYHLDTIENSSYHNIYGETVATKSKNLVGEVLAILNREEIDFDYREQFKIIICSYYNPHCHEYKVEIVLHKDFSEGGYLIEVRKKLRSDSFVRFDSTSVPQKLRSLFDKIRAEFERKDSVTSDPTSTAWTQSGGGIMASAESDTSAGRIAPSEALSSSDPTTTSWMQFGCGVVGADYVAQNEAKKSIGEGFRSVPKFGLTTSTADLERQRRDKINLCERFASVHDYRRNLDSVEMVRDNLLNPLIKAPEGDRLAEPLSEEVAQKVVGVFQSASKGLVEDCEPNDLQILVIFLLCYCLENGQRSSIGPGLVKEFWPNLHNFINLVEVPLAKRDSTRRRFQVIDTIGKLRGLLG